MSGNEVLPPVVVVANFQDFLDKGQPVEEGLTDEQVDNVSPLDLLNAANYTSKALRDERLAICKTCPELWRPTRTCKKCGCFMGMKTWLKDAGCPIGKWSAVVEATEP